VRLAAICMPVQSLRAGTDAFSPLAKMKPASASEVRELDAVTDRARALKSVATLYAASLVVVKRKPGEACRDLYAGAVPPRGH
jgi:hypothetical protein